LFAEHEALVPPFEPTQVHAQLSVSPLKSAFPLLQRLVVGLLEVVVPFEDPHTPLTGVTVELVVTFIKTIFAIPQVLQPPCVPADPLVQETSL
jgi:hypothetical protein